MQFHERAGQVESDARSRVVVLAAGGTLVESLEDGLEFVGIDALAAVLDVDAHMMGRVGQCDGDLSASGGKLEGVGQHVHEHLVEVVTVYPYRQLFVGMFEAEMDVLGFRLLLEEFVLVADEAHHVGLAHVHHHLSLVDLSEVHHLVDEMEDAFRVLAHHVVDTLPVGVLVFLDEAEQGSEDESERRAYLMADVHEEFQLRLAHLLGVDVFLQQQAVFLLALAVLEVEQAQAQKGEQVGELRPEAGVPDGVDGDGELPDGGLVTVADCLEPELVGACWEMGEGKFVLTRLHLLPFFAVDAVDIGNLFHIVIGEGRELQGETVVLVGEVELAALVYAALGDGIDARLHPRCHTAVAYQESGDVDGSLPGVLFHLVGIEPVDASRSAHDDDALVGRGAGGSIGKLIALQSVLGVEPGDGSIVGIQLAQSAGGADPNSSLVVLDDAGNAVAAQSVGGGVVPL